VSEFREKAAESLNRDADELIATIREIVDGRGSVKKRIACTACGQTDTYLVEVADVRTQLEAAKFLASEGLGKIVAPAANTELERRYQELLKTHPDDLAALTTEELILICAGAKRMDETDEQLTTKERLQQWRQKWGSKATIDELQTMIDELRAAQQPRAKGAQPKTP
jgi:hypothetical protein